MKGIITSRARKVGWRRCTLARVSDAPVALQPAGTGAVKAARSPRGDSLERTSGALKQYEYPICEITKTGLLPPGVINTGEFVHHRAWVGCASRTPRRAFVFIGCYRSLANWSRACVRTSRASRQAQRLHATAQQPRQLHLQRDASPWRAKLRRAPARAAACAAQCQLLRPVAVVLQPAGRASARKRH